MQHDFAESGKTIELNIIIKSDVVGSLEAIKKLLSEVHSQEASIKIISEGVGPVSESDATLAQATGSKVLAFRVPTLMAAKKIAEKEGIKIQRFDVIYELVDSAKADLSALLPPEIIEEEVGNIKILAIFRDDKKAFVAGGLVESGKVAVGDEIKVFQNNNEEYRDKVHSLRHGKSETKECVSGTECGLGLNPGANVAVGDRATIFRTVKKLRKIE
ncbi:MAG: Translation initiation factor IF-2 [bacterium ADurb.Bin212]|nr:MAG: Translation initiation factor IF-2 [bacterium ADurb.Bin212]